MSSREDLRRVEQELAGMLDTVTAMFERPAEVKVTLIVRTPWIEDGGIVIGDDEPEAAVAELRRLHPEAAERQGVDG